MTSDFATETDTAAASLSDKTPAAWISSSLHTELDLPAARTDSHLEWKLLSLVVLPGSLSDMDRREALSVGTDAGALYQTTEELLPEPHSCILTQVFLMSGTKTLLLPVGLMLAADSSP